ncbi:MAG: TolC family protein [Gemmatimonadetes bacterium]|nr:TolC family protein [Gemmatimonadota bacterium]
MSRRLILAMVALSPTLILPDDLGAQARRLTLEAALRVAASSHPDLRMAVAEVAAASGAVRSARARPNPEATATLGPATNADARLTSGQAGIGQTLELGGKRRFRTEEASMLESAAESRLQRTRDLIALGVYRAFSLAVLAEERVRTATDADSVGEALRQAAADRLRLGAGTLLELNVAAAAAARDRRNRLLAEQSLTAARYTLQSAIGLPASDEVQPEGPLPPSIGGGAALDAVALVQRALSLRPDLRARAHELEAASRRARLASALRWPDPAIGISAGRAEDFQVRLFTLSMPLPLWNRGVGDRAVAAARLTQAGVEAARARQDVEREVRVALQAYQRAAEATTAFESQVVERLRENLDLALESFRSGKISFFSYSTLRRDLVAARFDYLDALADLAERDYALAAAVGERLGGSRP